MKIIIGFVFITASTLIGYYFSGKYRFRKSFYTDFYNFNKTMENEVAFTKKTIEKIIENSNVDSCFYKNLIKIIHNENKDLTLKGLNDDEKDFFINYSQQIGKKESKTELAYLSSMETFIKDKMKIAVEEEKKYKTLYIKIGFLIGLVGFVLII